MQPNSSSIDTKTMESRYSSLDIPTHGNVPKWLEDMSNTVKRSKSEVDSKSFSDINNKNSTTPKIAEEYFDYLLKTPANVELASAKHGRRGNFSMNNTATPVLKLSKDLNEYIVPNISSIKLNEISILQTGSNLNRSEDQIQDVSNKADVSEDVKKYTPSILDKENGRQSRLNLDDTSFFNELISAITESYKPKKHSKGDSVSDNNPEILLTQNMSSVPKDRKKGKKLSSDHKSSENVLKLSIQNNLLNKVPINGEKTMLVFDETYKNKQQKHHGRKYISTPNKRTRYKKFKYKQSLTAKREAKPVDLSKILQKETIAQTHDEFIVPQLPSGSKMTINVLSTWGDRYYVGLNGIEIFASDGAPVLVKQVIAADVNSLPDCVNDPRVATNLFDGANRTHDDHHLWLAPFHAGNNHYIHVEFKTHSELAMLRIWNYNKSRIHSFRGARYVAITLDDVPIFKGEIAQASGSVNGNIESFGDTVLFTTEEAILEKVSQNDGAYKTLISNTNPDPSERNDDRPITASAPDQPQRPFTYANRSHKEQNQYIGTHRLDLVFMATWGRSDFMGLTGIEIMGDAESGIILSQCNLSCNFKANLSSLTDGENLTDDPKHMWTVACDPLKHVIITIKFDAYTYIAGLRIWNYNENIETTFCGARMVKIFLDNKLLPNPLAKDSTFILRRAPGNTNYDFVQEISFTTPAKIETTESIYDLNEISQFREETFEPASMPQGFVIQMVIYTTWGDQYYVGLNAVELYDDLGRMILLSENNICAHPESVNVLPGISGDIRTPDKLIDGVNETKDGTHAWLAPVVPKCLNRIYIVFDQPVTISVIKFWNYTKSPNRGVKEFGILVDDLLVYNGILDKANEKSPIKYQSILFTNNSDVIRKEMATLVKHSIDSQGTELINDKLRMTTGGSLPNVDQSLRPLTSVNHRRGRTSLST